MTKSVDDSVYDAALNVVKTTATGLIFLDAYPADLATANTNKLAEFTGLTTGDFTIANGTTNGRKVTVAAQTGATASATGNHNHSVLHNGTIILMVTESPAPEGITSGDTINSDAIDFEIADPV